MTVPPQREAIQVGGLQKFNIFDMRNQRMEYEANMFAAQIALPDDEILEYIYGGYDVGQIARIMCSDINLVALKVSGAEYAGTPIPRTGAPKQFLEMNCDKFVGWISAKAPERIEASNKMTSWKRRKKLR